MAKVRRPSRIAAIAQTLLGIRKGQQATAEQQTELDWLTQTMGLSRPIESYAPRTQRRYLAGASEGLSGERTRELEQVKRVSTAGQRGPFSAAQWQRVTELRDRIRDLGVDVEPYQEDFMLRDFGMIYGPDYVIQVLEEQIESTERAMAGYYQLGRMRWNAHERFDHKSPIVKHFSE